MQASNEYNDVVISVLYMIVELFLLAKPAFAFVLCGDHTFSWAVEEVIVKHGAFPRAARQILRIIRAAMSMDCVNRSLLPGAVQDHARQWREQRYDLLEKHHHAIARNPENLLLYLHLLLCSREDCLSFINTNGLNFVCEYLHDERRPQTTNPFSVALAVQLVYQILHHLLPHGGVSPEAQPLIVSAVEPQLNSRSPAIVQQSDELVNLVPAVVLPNHIPSSTASPPAEAPQGVSDTLRMENAERAQKRAKTEPSTGASIIQAHDKPASDDDSDTAVATMDTEETSDSDTNVPPPPVSDPSEEHQLISVESAAASSSPAELFAAPPQTIVSAPKGLSVWHMRSGVVEDELRRLCTTGLFDSPNNLLFSDADLKAMFMPWNVDWLVGALRFLLNVAGLEASAVREALLPLLSTSVTVPNVSETKATWPASILQLSAWQRHQCFYSVRYICLAHSQYMDCIARDAHLQLLAQQAKEESTAAKLQVVYLFSHPLSFLMLTVQAPDGVRMGSNEPLRVIVTDADGSTTVIPPEGAPTDGTSMDVSEPSAAASRKRPRQPDVCDIAGLFPTNRMQFRRLLRLRLRASVVPQVLSIIARWRREAYSTFESHPLNSPFDWVMYLDVGGREQGLQPCMCVRVIRRRIFHVHRSKSVLPSSTN